MSDKNFIAGSWTNRKNKREKSIKNRKSKSTYKYVRLKKLKLLVIMLRENNSWLEMISTIVLQFSDSKCSAILN